MHVVKQQKNEVIYYIIVKYIKTEKKHTQYKTNMKTYTKKMTKIKKSM